MDRFQIQTNCGKLLQSNLEGHLFLLHNGQVKMVNSPVSITDGKVRLLSRLYIDFVQCLMFS